MKAASIILLVPFGALFGWAVVDGSLAGSIAAGSALIGVCFQVAVAWIPSVRRWAKGYD
jgi:membrane associated rhomboid family serine protease